MTEEELLMTTLVQMGQDFQRALATDLHPVGFGFRATRPKDAVSLKNAGQGCVMPLIFSAAKGKTVAIDPNTAGWPCSAYYLGYADSIFPGIECYLSDGLPTRECERFIVGPEQARLYLERVRIRPPSTGVAVFEPLSRTDEGNRPEVVIFFADADRLSALVYLAHFHDPSFDERVVAPFASACAAVVTFPLKYARTGENKAVLGMHDIAARARLPKDLLSFAVPLALAERMHSDLDKSFLGTSKWEVLKKRSGSRPGSGSPDAPAREDQAALSSG